MKASLIITTYNWPEALSAVLTSVLRQTVMPHEIIVADDGSGAATAKVVKASLVSSGARWCHVRHPDSGIRQARIKNLGVRFSSGDYLIFIDHDVLLHPRFVEDHLAARAPGVFLQGKRAFLPGPVTQSILQGAVFHPPSPLLPGLENRKNALRCPWLGRLISRPRRWQTSLRGCNLSMHRAAFLSVGGYDETFDRIWGREDSDICYRLFHSGVRCRNLWFRALQYHLHHKVTKNTGKDRLDEELARVISERRETALQGMEQLSSEGEIVQASDAYSRGLEAG